jgi:hypothetical protein
MKKVMVVAASLMMLGVAACATVGKGKAPPPAPTAPVSIRG